MVLQRSTPAEPSCSLKLHSDLSRFWVRSEFFLSLPISEKQAGSLPSLTCPFCLRRPCDENHPQVKPDAYVNNLAEAVDVILSQL